MRTIRVAERAFELLLGHPLIGRERNELFIGLRSFPAGKYIIFYQPMDYGIEILRVRHRVTAVFNWVRPAAITRNVGADLCVCPGGA